MRESAVDRAARQAVAALDQHRGHLGTGIRFIGHGEFADAAVTLPGLSEWARHFRQRYVDPAGPLLR
jgi:hypothetical protein